MKKIYKPGDEITLSHFTKKQANAITNQIEILDTDYIALNHFSQKLKQDRDTMLELIKQSAPALRDYHFTLDHGAKTIKIIIDRRIKIQ